jgi:hypothetical protein
MLESGPKWSPRNEERVVKRNMPHHGYRPALAGFSNRLDNDNRLQCLRCRLRCLGFSVSSPSRTMSSSDEDSASTTATSCRGEINRRRWPRASIGAKLSTLRNASSMMICGDARTDDSVAVLDTPPTTLDVTGSEPVLTIPTVCRMSPI